MSDPRFVAPDFAPERVREGRSRPSCLATGESAPSTSAIFVRASRESHNPFTASGNHQRACDS